MTFSEKRGNVFLDKKIMKQHRVNLFTDAERLERKTLGQDARAKAAKFSSSMWEMFSQLHKEIDKVEATETQNDYLASKGSGMSTYYCSYSVDSIAY